MEHLSLIKRRQPTIPTLFPYTTLFRSDPALPEAEELVRERARGQRHHVQFEDGPAEVLQHVQPGRRVRDRKSTRLNSSHLVISYAVFCLKKKRINLRVMM